MSLDIALKATRTQEVRVFERNITHNLGAMAQKAGLYHLLWRPEELGITSAGELIKPLAEGLDKLKADPAYFMTFNPANGWGNYDGLVAFVESYLQACRDNPDATVDADR